MTDKQHWNEFVLRDVDLFRHDHCGYWLREIARGKNSRLVFVDEGRYMHGEEPGRQTAIDIWQGYLSQDMPEGFHVLDQETADKAWDIGVRRWGENWFDEVGDAETYDLVLQEALLGDVVYS